MASASSSVSPNAREMAMSMTITLVGPAIMSAP